VPRQSLATKVMVQSVAAEMFSVPPTLVGFPLRYGTTGPSPDWTMTPQPRTFGGFDVNADDHENACESAPAAVNVTVAVAIAISIALLMSWERPRFVLD